MASSSAQKSASVTELEPLPLYPTAAQIGSVRNTAIPMNKPTVRANTIGYGN